MSRDHRLIRRSQGHSSGSAVRPDIQQVARCLNYIIRGESLAAARIIAIAVMRSGDRVHMRFYECGQNGEVLVGQTGRSGPEVTIIVSARQ